MGCGKWRASCTRKLSRPLWMSARNSRARPGRIHDGEAPERPIRGQTSPEEARALVEEGVEIMPMPATPEESGLSGLFHRSVSGVAHDEPAARATGVL